MKRCDKCGQEHPDNQLHLQGADGKCTATATTDRSEVVRAEDDAVTAAGTSEGVKKSWETRKMGVGSKVRDIFGNVGEVKSHFTDGEHMTVGWEEGGETHVHHSWVKPHDGNNASGERRKAPAGHFGSPANKDRQGFWASENPDSDSIRAAGTSEGAKKGWEHRHIKTQNEGLGFHGTAFHSVINSKHGPDYDIFRGPESEYQAMSKAADNAYSKAVNDLGKAGYFDSHEDAREFLDSRHGRHLGDEVGHNLPVTSAKWLKDYIKMFKKESAKGSDQSAGDIVHCRAATGAGVSLSASEQWEVGKPSRFMWMPAGVHTINAGFRSGSIELTVLCDERTAKAVQASLDRWRAERPRQEPFGCVEHREQEASVRVGATQGFEWEPERGVYLAAEPTALGATNVNGKVHRSWSPSFTTDADYSKAKEAGGVLVFPEGVRGSRSNPARITGVDFCVGTLTNKPAFHEMAPVRGSEAVQAGAPLGNQNAAGHHNTSKFAAGTKVWLKRGSKSHIATVHDYDHEVGEYLVSTEHPDPNGLAAKQVVHHSVKEAQLEMAPAQFQTKASEELSVADRVAARHALEVVDGKVVTAGQAAATRTANSVLEAIYARAGANG